MRCLRCAIDYGPEEQFCRRCGRALSRPLGEKSTIVADGTASEPEAHFFYTTTAPPPLQPGVQGDDAAVAWEMPTPPRSNGASATTQGASAPRQVSSAQTPSAPPPPRPVNLAETAGFRISPESGPPTSDPHGGLPEQVVVAAMEKSANPPEDFFGADDDGHDPALVGAGSRATWAGASGYSGTAERTKKHFFALPRRRTTAFTEQARKRRAAVLTAIVAVVIIALGAYAFGRQRTYNSDLAQARNLALAGQYKEAVAAYNQAIMDWPFNGDAKSGLNAVRAAAAAIDQDAQAKARLQAQIDATRQAMYDAHVALIQQEVSTKQ
jgi:hypothetical protein